MKFLVVDHPCTNRANVVRWIESCGHTAKLKDIPCTLEHDVVLVLPGNGTFLAYLEFLEKNGWIQVIENQLKNRMPVVGICAGMQILSHKSRENKGR